MSRPAISTKQLTDTLCLIERHDGWWLWDETRGMNLAVRAKTPEAAFVDALSYYQRRLKIVEDERDDIYAKVAACKKIFQPESDEDSDNDE